MKRAVAAAAVAMVLMVAGCSSSDSSSKPLTTEQLQPMLLTVSDLPSGWSEDTSPSSSSDDSDSSTPACFQELQKIGDQDDSNEAEAKFVGGDQGLPSLNEQLGEMTSDEFTKGVDLLKNCSDVSFQSNGQTVQGSIEELSMDKVGDESAAFRMSFDVDGLPLTFDFSVTRVDEVGVLVAVADLGAADESLLAETTTKAVDKVKAGV